MDISRVQGSHGMGLADMTTIWGLNYSLGPQTEAPPPFPPREVPEPPFAMTFSVTLLYCLIFSCGVLGNMLIVYVVGWNRDMRNSTNYFLVNLSLADLLVLLICMPSAAMDLYAKGAWYLGPIMCEYLYVGFTFYDMGNMWKYIDGIVQERRNSTALAMDLHPSCTNPSIWG